MPLFNSGGLPADFKDNETTESILMKLDTLIHRKSDLGRDYKSKM